MNVSDERENEPRQSRPVGGGCCAEAASSAVSVARLGGKSGPVWQHCPQCVGLVQLELCVHTCVLMCACGGWCHGQW